MQTPFGKGVVREVRNDKRLLVDVKGRALVISDADVTALDPNARRSRSSDPGAADSHRADLVRSASPSAEIDLHGLTVEEALARVESALNDALLADADSLRLIHGRSGGKIRAALHKRLRELPCVRRFTLDPRNPGVTVVSF